MTPAEIPATVNSVKGSLQLIGVITENCRAGRESFEHLLASLSQGGAKVLRESDLDPAALQGRDLILCGNPRDASLLPALPPGVALSDSGFSIEADRYAAPDALLFLVLQFPGQDRRIAALFHPLSQAAAERYAPKITHYGKYGYLVFADGANRRKGTAPAQDGAAALSLRP